MGLSSIRAVFAARTSNLVGAESEDRTAPDLTKIRPCSERGCDRRLREEFSRMRRGVDMKLNKYYFGQGMYLAGVGVRRVEDMTEA